MRLKEQSSLRELAATLSTEHPSEMREIPGGYKPAPPELKRLNSDLYILTVPKDTKAVRLAQFKEDFEKLFKGSPEPIKMMVLPQPVEFNELPKYFNIDMALKLLRAGEYVAYEGMKGAEDGGYLCMSHEVIWHVLDSKTNGAAGWVPEQAAILSTKWYRITK